MFENLYDNHPPPEGDDQGLDYLVVIKQLLHLLCVREDGGIYSGIKEDCDITDHLEELLRLHDIKLSEVI